MTDMSSFDSFTPKKPRTVVYDGDSISTLMKRPDGVPAFVTLVSGPNEVDPSRTPAKISADFIEYIERLKAAGWSV